MGDNCLDDSLEGRLRAVIAVVNALLNDRYRRDIGTLVGQCARKRGEAQVSEKA